MTMLASWNSGQGYMNDCEAPWNMRQYVTADACFTLSVPEISELSTITLYPNPALAGQLITLKTNRPIRSFEIFNAFGHTIHRSSNRNFSLDKTGWYMLGIIYEDGTHQAAKFQILR
jgi:hypothetical protein